MITGDDRVMVVMGADVSHAIRLFLDSWGRRWPSMRVAVEGEGMPLSDFVPWVEARDLVPPVAGDVLVSRDDGMDEAWSEHGYTVRDGREGPFMISFQAGPSVLKCRVLEDPYLPHRDGAPVEDEMFEPYDVTLIAPASSLVTLVAPEGPGASVFSDELEGDLVSFLGAAGHVRAAK